MTAKKKKISLNVLTTDSLPYQFACAKNVAVTLKKKM